MTSETYVERRAPLSRRRPALRCVINVCEGAGAKKFCRSNDRARRAKENGGRRGEKIHFHVSDGRVGL